MTSDYLKHVRSLEHLRGLIERDYTSEARKATAGFVEDVGKMAEKIANDAEQMTARVKAEAK
ncbi:MAG: hypothetical protein IH994_07510 [Proteobacteria bacterium]|nr:hypothetical protein [Pseudomonadota bacterium]